MGKSSSRGAIIAPGSLAILMIAAALVGFVKTGLPSLGILIPALMAISFPAKESVGTLLLYLLVGDVMAVYYYRKSAHTKEIWRLMPWVAVGIALGATVLGTVSDSDLKGILGALVILLAAGELLRFRWRTKLEKATRVLRPIIGICAGIATTVGNAAGPFMAVYLLLMNLDKTRFMGTTAIFFLTVNLSKIPIFAHLGMIQWRYVETFLWTFPIVCLGAVIGRKFLNRISTEVFRHLILGLTSLAGILLLINYAYSF